MKKLQEEKNSLENSLGDLVKEKSLLETRLREAEMKLEQRDREIVSLRNSEAFNKYHKLQVGSYCTDLLLGSNNFFSQPEQCARAEANQSCARKKF